MEEHHGAIKQLAKLIIQLSCLHLVKDNAWRHIMFETVEVISTFIRASQSQKTDSLITANFDLPWQNPAQPSHIPIFWQYFISLLRSSLKETEYQIVCNRTSEKSHGSCLFIPSVSTDIEHKSIKVKQKGNNSQNSPVSWKLLLHNYTATANRFCRKRNHWLDYVQKLL